MTASPADGEAKSTRNSRTPFVLGVDGGGTKTLARVAHLDESGQLEVMGEGTAGSSNQVAVDFATAHRHLQQSIEDACAVAGISSDTISASVFALAGTGTEEAQQRTLHFAANQLQLANVQVVHDGEAVLAAGTPDCWGVALIVGTGSVAFGVNPNGETEVVGGWGYWFGDEGSAYWLGQTALRAIAQAADGRAPATELTQRVLQSLRIDSPRQILTALSKQGDVRLGIANLASLVCISASKRDQVANALLDTAARHWVGHLECVVQRLEMDEPTPIAIAGGVLCGSEFAQALLLQTLQTSGLSNSSLEFVDEPVMGCLKLAARHMQTR